MKTKQYIAPKIHRNDFLLYNQSNGLRNKERRKGKKNFIRLLSYQLCMVRKEVMKEKAEKK